MDKKYYECNEELAAILLKNGFMETTNLVDQQKGKKEFRIGPKRSRLVIQFDYMNFKLLEESSGCNFRSAKIPQDDLNMLLWYAQSTTTDKNHISDGHFDINRVRQNVETMTSLLAYSREFKHQNAESKRFQRLLNNLDTVQTN